MLLVVMSLLNSMILVAMLLLTVMIRVVMLLFNTLMVEMMLMCIDGCDGTGSYEHTYAVICMLLVCC